MTEQIYINGVLMQRSAGASPAALVYQTPFFTDLDSIVSNRSNSVDFPTTRHNLRAIEGTANYAYRAHSVTYFLDGVQLFAGRATLLSVTPTSMSFSFTWGNAGAFQKLLDLKLRDLPEDYVKWDYDTMAGDSEHYDPTMNFGVGNSAKDSSGNYVYVNHPFVKVPDILAALESASGVSIEGKDSFANYVIPCVSKQTDDYARKYNGIVRTSTASTVAVLQTDKSMTTYYLFLPFTSSDDPSGMAIGSKGAIDVSGIDTLHIVIPARGVDMTIGANTIPVLGLVAVDNEDCAVVSKELWVGGKFDETQLASRHAVLTEAVDLKIDVSDYSYVALALAVSLGYAVSTGTVYASFNSAPEIYIYDEDETAVLYGGMFPLMGNLPDWTGSQLLKNLLKVEGLFPVCPDDRTIRLVSVSELYNNRAKASDWTERLMLTSGRPTEKTTSFGNFARINRFKWAEDDTVTGNYDGEMPVDDESLDAETDLLTMDFAATDTNVNGNPIIRAYSKTTDDDGNVVVEFREVVPRLLFESTTAGTTHFSGLSFESIIRNKYDTYAAAVLHPEVIKASVRISAYELQTLDLSVPVYSYQLRGYYAITKLTTKKDNTADVELLRLGEYRESTGLPTSVTDLCIVQEDGECVTRIPSLNESQATAMAASSDYKVVMLRYGYTRRGKHIKDEAKGINTHTDRKKFRNYRGGLTWRIIGEELLRTGKLSEHSQAFGSYVECSLVTKLGAIIVLPRSHAKTSRKGYVKNTARDGLCELWLALYHKIGRNKWECISNKVQVRGISEDHKKVWEYTPTNIVYVAE